MPGRGAQLRSLRRRSLRDGALEEIRAAILGGELEAGSIHSAVTLAEQMGVSPTPVREAMLELVRSGLVEVLPNRGFRVTVIEDSDLDEIVAVRTMLEVPAMRLVIDRATDTQLDALEEPLGEMQAAAARGDVPGFLVADRDFHLQLLSLTGYRRLVDTVAGLRDQTRIVGLHSLAQAGVLEASAAEHPPVLEAVRRRDKRLAEREMASHLKKTRTLWAGREDPAGRAPAID